MIMRSVSTIGDFQTRAWERAGRSTAMPPGRDAREEPDAKVGIVAKLMAEDAEGTWGICFGCCSPGSRVSMRPRLSDVCRATVQRYESTFPAARLGTASDMLSQWPGERDGRLSRVDPRLLQEATSPQPSPRPASDSFNRPGSPRAHPGSGSSSRIIGMKFLRIRAEPRAAKKLGRASCRTQEDLLDDRTDAASHGYRSSR